MYIKTVPIKLNIFILLKHLYIVIQLGILIIKY